MTTSRYCQIRELYTGVLVSNTHMAPSWVQKLPAGIRCEPVAMVMSEENVAVPVEP